MATGVLRMGAWVWLVWKHGMPWPTLLVMFLRFNSMYYAFSDPTEKVQTGLKLVLKGPEETVVGLHIIGPASDEMLQVWYGDMPCVRL